MEEVKKKRRQGEEQKIQTKIREWCKKVGLFCYKNNTVGIYDPRSGTYIPAPRKGITDLTVLRNSTAYYVEVKKPGGVVSDDQKLFIEDVQKTGNQAMVVYSFEEFYDFFSKIV